MASTYSGNSTSLALMGGTGLAEVFSAEGRAARAGQRALAVGHIEEAVKAALYENRSRLRMEAGARGARRGMDLFLAVQDYAGENEGAAQIGGLYVESAVVADAEDFATTFRRA